ncbi:unnamed protein product [Lactuca virosa]|uniref:Zinc finger GRF-type domain-containing protein n=1 Tax=Lactuca virosa TaxID=75947 RepID=A0AAU9M5M3_9ASTR|nr:unnamed protein product [Lactuca virosa]
MKISKSDKNPDRRDFGCMYWLDKDEDCGYLEWYDGEVSPLYKELLLEVMAKKKKNIGQGKRNPYHGEISLVFLVRVCDWFACYFTSHGRNFDVDGVQGVSRKKLW